MSFVRDACLERLHAIVREIRGAGFSLKVDDDSIELRGPAESGCSVIELNGLALPAPAAGTEKPAPDFVPETEPIQKRRGPRRQHDGCSFAGCDGKHLARGMCSKHYGQWLAAEKKKAKK